MRNILVMISLLLYAESVMAEGDWHQSLYLGNDGYWHQRIRVDIENRQDHEAMGEPAALRIGDGPGEANLVGARAEAVHVYDSNGAEMLYNIAGLTEWKWGQISIYHLFKRGSHYQLHLQRSRESYHIKQPERDNDKLHL